MISLSIKKALLAAALLICTCSPGVISAQTKHAKLSLKIVNPDTRGGISTVSVKISDGNGDSSHYYTDDNGCLSVDSLAYGDYKLEARFIAYEDLRIDIAVDKDEVNLGELEMKPNSTLLKELVVEAVAMRTSLRGDTIIYNAAAFKVTNDAHLINLLEKMPGITVDKDGKIAAQGKDVKKILVDGKEYFRDDSDKTASTLPADMVDKVEVYDSLSDHAQLTGVDDGEGYKTINIVTHKNKRIGMFGDVDLRYGFSDIYIASGNITLFENDRRINAYGFFDKRKNRNISGMGSVYYNDAWGRKKRLQFEGSYFTMHGKETTYNDTETWFLLDDGNTWYTESLSRNRSKNYTHSFSGGITYEDGKTTVKADARVTFGNIKTGEESSVRQETQFQDGTSVPLQLTRIASESDSDDYSVFFSLNVGQKLGKPGRSVGVSMSGKYDSGNNVNIPSQYFYFPPYAEGNEPDSLFIRRIKADIYSYNFGGKVTYTEPLGEKIMLNGDYSLSYNYSDQGTRTYLWDQIINGYSPVFDDDLSSIYDSGYLTQKVGAGLNFNDKKYTLNSSLYYQNSSMRNRQTMPYELNKSYSFDNVGYLVNARLKFDSQNNLNIQLQSKTTNPTLQQLLEIPDLTRTSLVTVGNSRLDPAYSHSAYMYYTHSKPEKGITVFAHLRGEFSNNPVVSSTTTGAGVVIPNSGGMLLGEGNRLVEYVNLKGSPKMSINSSVGYGFPVNPIKCNITVSLNYDYSRMPALMNSVRMITNRSTYGFGVNIGSNISENADFQLYSNTYYTNSTAMAGASGNRSLGQWTHGSMKFILWKGFTLTGTISHNYTRDYDYGHDISSVRASLYVGKKVFRNQMGEVTVGVSDIFGNSTYHYRLVNAQSIVHSTSNYTVGRYFSVGFKYNFRNYKASKDGGQTQGNFIRRVF